ncbi:hypothetical protein KDL45_01405 [bacterium]|nr:hypothetical protein [bacterium]
MLHSRPAIVRSALIVTTCLVAMLVGLSGAAQAAIGVPGYIQKLEQETHRIRLDLAELRQERNALDLESRRLAAEITSIKSQKDPGFLERRRLERLLRDSQQIASQLQSMTERLEALEEREQNATRRVYAAYSTEMEKLSEAIAKEKRRSDMVEMTRQFILLRQNREKYRPPEANVERYDFLGVETPENLTRDQVVATIDLLIQRKYRVRAIISNVETEIKELKKELDLSRQMETLVQENNLFEEGVIFSNQPRSPVDRPDDGTNVDSGEPVHVSPITGSDSEGGGTMTGGLQQEIERLQGVLKYLRDIVRRLDEQILQLRDRLRQGRRDVPAPPTARLDRAAMVAEGRPS